MDFRIPRSFVFSLALLVLPFTMQAQSASKTAEEASVTLQLNDAFVLSLPDAETMAPQYELAVADLGMTDTKAVQRMVNGMSDNLVRFRLNEDANTILLEPQYQYKSDWKVEDWNTYLQELAPRFRRHKELAQQH